jgi:hypothetical protein
MYAVYICAGYCHADAVALTGFNEKSVERWKRSLRAAGKLYFGRPVSYEFAARFALDPAFRDLLRQLPPK